MCHGVDTLLSSPSPDSVLVSETPALPPPSIHPSIPFHVIHMPPNLRQPARSASLPVITQLLDESEEKSKRPYPYMILWTLGLYKRGLELVFCGCFACRCTFGVLVRASVVNGCCQRVYT